MAVRTGKRSSRRPARRAAGTPEPRGVTLTGFDSAEPVSLTASFSAGGLVAQHIKVQTQQACGFDWQGPSHYLALHDLNTGEAETFVDDQPVERRADLRGRMTYLPPGCRVWGWSRPLPGPQSLTALYVDPARLEPDLAARLRPLADRGQIYFRHPALFATLTKLRHCLEREAAPDPLYVESLSLLALVEWSRVRPETEAPKGALGAQAVARIAAYVDAHLDQDISLEQLAQLVNLSRFHFVRAYRQATRETPYQFLLRQRVERAQLLLRDPQRRIAEVAGAVGFKNATRLNVAFRKLTHLTPSDYRRALRP